MIDSCILMSPDFFPHFLSHSSHRSQGRRALEDDSGERTWQYRGNSSEAPIVVAARKAGLPEDITAQQLGDGNPLGESIGNQSGIRELMGIL